MMDALTQMEHEIKSERVTDGQVRSALSLIEGGATDAQVARDLGMSRATFYRRS